MTDYAYVLTKKFPNALWELSGNKYADIIWKCDTPQPTQKELDDLAPIVKTEDKTKQTTKQVARQAVLDKLGLTADEASALFD